jgi:hypothetical protein
MRFFTSSAVKKEMAPINEAIDDALKNAEKKLEIVQDGYKNAHLSTDYGQPGSKEKFISDCDMNKLEALRKQARKELAAKLHEIAQKIEEYKI